MTSFTPPAGLAKAADLIARSIQQGMMISPDKGALSIKFPKSKGVEKELLQELSLHKSDLIKYFECFDHSPLDPGGLQAYSNTVFYDGQQYHRLTPTMFYWVNDKVDSGFKQADDIHGTCLSCWHAHGNFDPGTFNKAFACLVKRHESLRTTIHYLDGEYLAKTEDPDSALYIPEYKDMRAGKQDAMAIEKLIRFDRHVFDLQKGPLLLARLIQVEEDKFIVAIKMHHCITDAWSNDILAKDLLMAYKFISEKQPVQMPPLQYQLKDYLACINNDFREYYERDKKYWNNLYHNAPPPLTIPGAHRPQSHWHEKICKNETFVATAGLSARLSTLSKEYATSVFIIIQAAFKSFLRSKTGQQDIVIGTYVLGRDYPGIEEQVGCYAKAMFVRTLLDDAASFPEVIQKVKKANEDMQTYKTYRLLDAIREKLQGEQTGYASFWKINLQYADFRRSFSRQGEAMVDAFKSSDISFVHKGMALNSHIAIDMQLRFVYYPDKLELFVEYDSSLYTPAAICEFIGDYLKYMQQITGDPKPAHPYIPHEA